MAAAALSLSTNYLAPGLCATSMGGYAYSYADTGGSTACVDTIALCGMGTTGLQTPANSMTVWGAGFGVNLNQGMGTMTPGVCAATGGGIAYALTGALPPQGMRIVIDNAGKDYCAPLAATSGTVPWSAFNTQCWAPAGGVGLTGAPTMATHLQFQVNAGAAAGTFDFCVTSLKFM
jgi:hypothetical protein